jgi:peptidoglycan endopeptidase LytE
MVGRRTILTLGLISLFLMVLFAGTGFADVRYKVRSGDNLSKIAKKHGVTPQVLRDANHLKSDALKIQQVLVIPGSKGKIKKVSKGKAGKKLPADCEIYVVKKGDTLRSVAEDAGISVKELRAMNQGCPKKLKRGQRLVVPKREVPGDMDELGDADDAASSTEVAEKEGEEEKKAVDAQALGRWRSADERRLFVRMTRTFLGVPYRLGGSTMKGIDCSAFVKRLYEIFDIQLPRTARDQARIGKRVTKDQLEEGDLVFFKTRSRRVTGHVGIYIGNNEFIHASGKNRGTKLDSLESDYYSKRFVRGVRVLELEQELAKKL